MMTKKGFHATFGTVAIVFQIICGLVLASHNIGLALLTIPGICYSLYNLINNTK